VASSSEVAPDSAAVVRSRRRGALRRARARSENRGGRLPALALTAYADPEDVREALAAGFQMHLAKPVTPGELLRGIAELVGRLDAS
jgi:CheY-like chemotaxis protein